MSPALIVALVLGAAVVGAVAGGVVSARSTRSARAARSAQADQLRDSQEAIAALQARVDALIAPGAGRSSDYLITTMADEAQEPVPDIGAGRESVALTGREFTSVAVSESVVRVASLAHGVRRAVSSRARARIRFEMRQELKRTRRQRRVELKAARRHLRTQGEPAADRKRDAA